MNTGKCPKCDKTISKVELEHITINFKMKPAWKGVSYLCPSCRYVLSVGHDHLAMNADLVKDIADELRR